MEISKTLEHGTYDITLTGSFTFNDHSEFREILQKIEDEAIQNVVFHLQGLTFVDSAALGMFLLVLDETERNQKKLVLSGASGQVKKIFELARFHTLFMMVA